MFLVIKSRGKIKIFVHFFLFFYFFFSSFLKFRTFFSRFFTDFHHVLTIFPAFLLVILVSVSSSPRAVLFPHVFFFFLSLPSRFFFLGGSFQDRISSITFRLLFLVFERYFYPIICFSAISQNFSTRFYDTFFFFFFNRISRQVFRFNYYPSYEEYFTFSFFFFFLRKTNLPSPFRKFLSNDPRYYSNYEIIKL